MSEIKIKVENLLKEIPENVKVVAAVKGRKPEEILQAIEGGIRIIGENYVQETLKIKEKINIPELSWHFIGHLQTNKVKYAVKLYDMIETVDSLKVAEEIDKYCKKYNKIMPVLIEVNIGEEKQKSGVMPEEVESLVRKISKFENIKIKGIMTMGPLVKNLEEIRPYFKKTKEIYEKIKSFNIENVEMEFLSMGMSDTYKIAIEEGANIIRIGRKIFE
jgi:pyridoxal phosphate enzyme (YggS family)